MNPSPLISICIPVYNGASLIRRALESAIHQSYRNLEIVVLDNISTDGTAEMVKRYAAHDARIRYVKRETHTEFTRNFLDVFERARGELVQLLCHDDWLSRHYIERAVAAFAKNPDGAAVYPHVANFSLDPDEKLTPRYLINFPPGRYSTASFAERMYRTEWASNCILSLMRRNDVVVASARIRSLLSDASSPHHRFYERGPAMDWLLFLGVISRYRYFVVGEGMTYVKLEHGLNEGTRHGWDFTSVGGILEYHHFLRATLTPIYRERFSLFLRRMRRYFGVTALIVLFKHIGRTKRARGNDKDSPMNLARFLSDYAWWELPLVWLSTVGLFVARLVRFGVRKLVKRGMLSPYDREYFLDAGGRFTV